MRCHVARSEAVQRRNARAELTRQNDAPENFAVIVERPSNGVSVRGTIDIRRGRRHSLNT